MITRPAVLTNEPATGDIRVFSEDGRWRAQSITRADLAAFLVAQLAAEEHLRAARRSVADLHVSHRFKHDGETPKSFATWATEESESR